MGKSIQIYTDASYRHKTGDGSYSFIVLINGRISHQFCKTTFGIKSNCLEFTAIKYGLKNVVKNYLQNGCDVESIDMYTDSQNCVNYVTNKNIVRDPILLQLKKDVDEIIANIYEHYPVKLYFHHVKGHSDVKLNVIVDKICTLISEYNRDFTLSENNNK